MFVSDDTVKAVVDVLYKCEKDLSDGYEYYCGGETKEEINEILSKIAREILEAVKLESGGEGHAKK